MKLISATFSLNFTSSQTGKQDKYQAVYCHSRLFPLQCFKFLPQNYQIYKPEIKHKISVRNDDN